MGLKFDALPLKEQLFVLAKVEGLSDKKAAIKAGFEPNNGLAKAVKEFAYRDDIKEAIKECKDERSERARYDADKVLYRLLEIDALDVAEILDDEGAVLPISAWNEAWRRSVGEVSVRQGADGSSVVKVKLPDKLKNLELIGKHIGVQAFKENVSAQVSLSGIDALYAKRLVGES